MSFRILVVDDEPNIVNILRSNLEREGYKVLAAYDGEEALKLDATRDPHLILLDCMLPGVDGFDVCNIRRDRRCPLLC